MVERSANLQPLQPVWPGKQPCRGGPAVVLLYLIAIGVKDVGPVDV